MIKKKDICCAYLCGARFKLKRYMLQFFNFQCLNPFLKSSFTCLWNYIFSGIRKCSSVLSSREKLNSMMNSSEKGKLVVPWKKGKKRRMQGPHLIFAKSSDCSPLFLQVGIWSSDSLFNPCVAIVRTSHFKVIQSDDICPTVKHLWSWWKFILPEWWQ